ncbi:hypothetical protein HN51_043047 [Arachis hypogaea]|uniref:DUF868 domain-containing protein n=1 Tax=Arachis hypogaea TaxID=3818 RepID=A0A444Y7E6_ARAHY|nr:uncharacterized protein LOC107614530 [Arachis ipaensis]XP_025673783.1 uncharacterized protein LOC112772967 [Arachis hypogaea]QHN95165.1 uncharacterized protein DS421_18g607200 [Arachis hypogaea]RYQ97870.1 hypothetical protein Ahy_B08g093945 [Arachis hypogaea]
MRDIMSCFSENAVNVRQQASCSSYSSSSNACINPSLTPSTRNSVSSVYRSTLSNKHQILMITVTWCKSFSNQGLTISFGTQDPPSPPFRLNTNSRFFRKKKGSKLMVESSNHESRIEVFWDLSNAKYDTGPEPVDGFYVAVVVGLEIALIIGHIAEESVTKKLKAMAATSSGKFSLLSRREHCSGNTLYTTKAQFCENGTWHDIMIRCSGGNGNEGLLKSSSSSSSPPPALMVCIDKKTVIRVKRLQWNFRGNQTIFVDGLLVDLLWDVHNWFFNPSSSSSSSGYAVFMFRTRSGLDSRLWLQEKPSLKDKDALEFSFLIYACKTA